MTERTNYHTYEGEQFRFEVILDDLDDMYHPYTLLLAAYRTKNMISGETFYNEIELKKWDNDDFKVFLDNINLGDSCEFKTYVRFDPRDPITMRYCKDQNILIIPLREGTHYTCDIRITVDQVTIDELSLLHGTIEKGLEICQPKKIEI